MILNPTQAIVTDLQSWHYWWPWMPIRITCRSEDGSINRYGFRWLFVVKRKIVYDTYSGGYMWTDYRDIST